MRISKKEKTAIDDTLKMEVIEAMSNKKFLFFDFILTSLFLILILTYLL
ncbi:hypothetical protein ACE38V_04680 [Cytobacillus sp. Hz8]